ncbi:peptidoglycan-binding domain-containing protein [Serinicoccus sediminis]|uniref:peptidoglycan-binding domain-containing protein n=1 Tax=Serinicoccus sediminis TaxID=2306021 RepID=UPI00101ECC4D|nr:peptidoglycan-binding domain-containing protein [Serinicoccus sediminis]
MPTARDFLDQCAKHVGETGDNSTWLGLAAEVPDASLKRWADWDSPYCQGGIQLAMIRVGMGLVPCTLPYYVPSMEQYARNQGAWVDFDDIQPGDFIIFDWGGDGIGDHIGPARARPQGNSVATVEWNTSKDDSGSQSNGRGCWNRTRYRSQIRGAYRPPWTAYSQHGYDLAHWRQVQIDLTTLGRDPGPADGVNGPKTNAAVKAFQSRWGLERDGIPGPITQAEIRRQLKAQSEPKPPPAPEPPMPTPAPAPEPEPDLEVPDVVDPDAPNFTRLGGETSMATSVLLQQLDPPADGEARAYLVAHDSPVHGLIPRDGVVLLGRRGAGTLAPEVRDFLATARATELVVVGGPNAVTPILAATVYQEISA